MVDVNKKTAASTHANWRMFLLLLYKAIRMRKSRVLIALSSIMVGAAIITALASVYFDISIKMSRELRAYGANFFIGPTSDAQERFMDLAVFGSVLNSIPSANLVGASPYLYGVVRLDLDQAILAGVDFSGLRKIAPYWQVQGEWIGVDFDEKHCMVGKTLAENMALKVGGRVNVINQETGFQTELVIKGIMETGQAEDQQIFVNLALAQRILGQSGIINHALFSLVSQGLDIDALAADIHQTFPAIDARPIRKISHSEGQILERIKGLMALVAGIILVITTLCVNTTLTAMVLERRREIGLQKALGADDRAIALQFLSETALICTVGVTLGLLVGFALAQALGQAVFQSAINFRPEVIPLTLGISITAALIAAAWPIRQAVQVVPARVLRED